MQHRSGDRPLLLPFLAPLCADLEPLAYAELRLTSGLILAEFGWSKLFGGGKGRDIERFQPLEFVGGIAVGLLTRPFAQMLFVQLLIIVVMVMIPRGTGYHLTAVWLGTYALMALYGGGRLSLDRWLGREF